MAKKYQLSDAPPPYTYVNPSTQQAGPIIILDKNEKSVFHNGARFNEFSKPQIPPPPPGCAPNALQQMQQERGPIEVLLPQSHENQGFDGHKT